MAAELSYIFEGRHELTDRKPSLGAELVGGAAGLLPGGALLQGPTTRLVQHAMDELARRNSTALLAAERACGMTREDMAEVLDQNPGVVPIAARVLFQAGMTNQEEMLEALGAMLGALLLTPEDTDETELIIIGLNDMTRVHLQVLRALEGAPQVHASPEQEEDFVDRFERAKSEHPVNPPDGPAVLRPSDTWSEAALVQVSGLSLTRVQLALAGLQRSGFLRTPTVLDGPGYVISTAGRTVLEVVRRFQEVAPIRHPPKPS